MSTNRITPPTQQEVADALDKVGKTFGQQRGAFMSSLAGADEGPGSGMGAHMRAAIVDAMSSGTMTYLKNLGATPVLWELAANQFFGPESPALRAFEMYAMSLVGDITQTFAAAKQGNAGTNAAPAKKR